MGNRQNDSFFSKIIEDTLRTEGKWARKSLTMLVSFTFTLIVGAFIVVSDSVIETEINRYAIDVFDTMVIFTATLTGLTLTDKKIANRNKDVNG